MQLANRTPGANGQTEGIRTAVQRDAGPIMRLLQTAELAHVHVDWRLPGEWLGEPAFLVHERPSEDGSHLGFLSRTRPSLDTVLCVAADPPPAAWIRISGAKEAAELTVLEEMIRIAIDVVRPEVNEIAWFVTDQWPVFWLEQQGFAVADDVLTYRKHDFSIPPVESVTDLHIRPAHEDEMDELAYIEELAFEPRWRHSADGLGMARKQSLCFDVAEVGGTLVGFQFSTRSQNSAHLARMTIHPDWQGRGIGGALLAEALATYQSAGSAYSTLNTQRTNEPSHKLYSRFGFEPTGQHFPVWSLGI